MSRVRYSSKAGNHQDFDYAGSKPRSHEGAEKLPVVDDVKGHSALANEPDDVKGHAGNLQSASEARKI